jgi:hypothetical protein
MSLHGYTFPCRQRSSHSGDALGVEPTLGVTLTVIVDPELAL